MTKLVRVLAMWLNVTCAIAMFTHLYKEYRLHIVVDTFHLYGLSSHINLNVAEC